MPEGMHSWGACIPGAWIVGGLCAKEGGVCMPRGNACVPSGHAWQWGVHRWGRAWWEVCMSRMTPRHHKIQLVNAWPVRILLECILVFLVCFLEEVVFIFDFHFTID